jgi:hypothetical protein
MELYHLSSLICRDLEKLISELRSYSQEADIWKTSGTIPNSAGNLILHLVGNLNFYLGAVLGGSDYVRNRDLEFSAKGIAREQLVAMVEETIGMVKDTLSTLSPEELGKEYPVVVLGETKPTGYFLLHVAMHLAYHLGQINYHRRRI